ncbi:Transmembrane [Penicillium expansum]|nr:Transmembrane [Penicillium expansum]
MANNRVPINYEVPSFPSLYSPLPATHQQAYYLYYTKDIWRFTLFWTLIFYSATHLAVAGCAVLTHFRHCNVIWIVPLVYIFIAAFESLLAGSIIGVVQFQDVDFATDDMGWCQCYGSYCHQLPYARWSLNGISAAIPFDLATYKIYWLSTWTATTNSEYVQPIYTNSLVDKESGDLEMPENFL